MMIRQFYILTLFTSLLLFSAQPLFSSPLKHVKGIQKKEFLILGISPNTGKLLCIRVTSREPAAIQEEKTFTIYNDGSEFVTSFELCRCAPKENPEEVRLFSCIPIGPTYKEIVVDDTYSGFIDDPYENPEPTVGKMVTENPKLYTGTQQTVFYPSVDYEPINNKILLPYYYSFNGLSMEATAEFSKQLNRDIVYYSANVIFMIAPLPGLGEVLFARAASSAIKNVLLRFAANPGTLGKFAKFIGNVTTNPVVTIPAKFVTSTCDKVATVSAADYGVKQACGINEKDIIEVEDYNNTNFVLSLLSKERLSEGGAMSVGKIEKVFDIIRRVLYQKNTGYEAYWVPLDGRPNILVPKDNLYKDKKASYEEYLKKNNLQKLSSSNYKSREIIQDEIDENIKNKSIPPSMKNESTRVVTPIVPITELKK